MNNIQSVEQLLEMVFWSGQHNQYPDSNREPEMTVSQALADLLKLIEGVLPKKHECTDECNINSDDWRIGHRAYKDAESNVLEETHAALLKLFGGNEK